MMDLVVRVGGRFQSEFGGAPWDLVVMATTSDIFLWFLRLTRSIVDVAIRKFFKICNFFM
jgi:hypothetical protein